MILVITLSSLRINAIYLKWIASRNWLYTGVFVMVLSLLVGSGVGGYGGLFQVTINEIDEGLPALTKYLNTVLFTLSGTCRCLISSWDLVSMFSSIELQSFAVYVYNVVISVYDNLNFLTHSFTQEVNTIAVYCFNSVISSYIAYAEFNDFFITSAYEPPLIFYDILTNKPLIFALLSQMAGVYMLLNRTNGKCYIGSSNNLGKRIMQHIKGYKSNILLKRAIRLYGLGCFSLIILTICHPDPIALIAAEQLAFDQFKPAYNIYLVAGSPLGYKHTEEAKKKISQANSGANNPWFGKHNPNEFLPGPANPMFGQIPANSVFVYVYDTDNNLIETFHSRTALAKWLKASRNTVIKYMASGEVFRGKYILKGTRSSR